MLASQAGIIKNNEQVAWTVGKPNIGGTTCGVGAHTSVSSGEQLYEFDYRNNASRYW